MLSACKNAFLERVAILKINIRNSYLQETAYFGNNWASVLSTVLYTATYLLFVNVIFSNVQLLAGYNKNEMLFLTLMGQLNYYTLATISLPNADKMIEDVNRGNLDLILVRPVPSLFYVSLRDINLLGFFKVAAIPLLFIASTMDWSALSFSSTTVLLGAVSFIFGIIAGDAVKFLLSLPVFWQGEAQELSTFIYPLTSGNFPWEGLGTGMKIGFGVILPTLISISIASSVFLSKSDPYTLTGWAIAVGSLFLWLKITTWKYALRNYTSASS
jgi:ABC-2 type transport system permease protein